MSDRFWKTVTASEYAHEREGLEFIRAGLPDREPFRAWSNFEFIADDGSINEVDLLVLTPAGFFIVELKHWAGTISGDDRIWTIERDGRVRSADNPLLLTNSKCRRLKSLLERHHPRGNKYKIPFLEPLVFLSHPDVQLKLSADARSRIVLTDREAKDGKPARPGILAALLERKGYGLEGRSRDRLNKPIAKAVSRAMQQAGIRPSQKSLRIGDYELQELLAEDTQRLYQEYRGCHVSLPSETKRVRLYHVERSPSQEQREIARRAAEREYRLLKSLRHEGILGASNFTEDERGPAVVFDDAPGYQRLDHFLAEQGDSLGLSERLAIIRKIAEALKYAHEQRVIHRALSPASVLIADGDGGSPKVKIFDWNVGFRVPGTAGASRHSTIAPTAHLSDLVQDRSRVYMAPEAPAQQHAELPYTLDLFSLGAVAFHVLTGQPPADDVQQLIARVGQSSGLRLSSVSDAFPEDLELLVSIATDPSPMGRFDSVTEFLENLDRAEDQMTAPEDSTIDPRDARAGDELAGGFMVQRRLGTGSTSVVLRVERDGTSSVLKVASSVSHNERLQQEAEVLHKLRHPNIVELIDVHEIGGYTTLEMVDAGDATLAARIRQDGRLSYEWLKRFGEQLLSILVYLEREGIAHRDIKPDNIGIAPRGKNDEQTLILFDFSLSRAPTDQIEAGTQAYLDPFLGTPERPRWDPAAERYAAAMTLHEMATGTLPVWGDGQTLPRLMADPQVHLPVESFDAEVREPLRDFFQRALCAKHTDRHDTAEAMLEAWRHAFRHAEPAAAPAQEQTDVSGDALSQVQLDTQLAELPLGTRARNTVDRAGLSTVSDLLSYPLNRLSSMRGVGNKTRKELVDLTRLLRGWFSEHDLQRAEAAGATVPPPAPFDEVPEDPAVPLSVDQAFAGLVPKAKNASDRAPLAVELFCRLRDANDDGDALPPGWPSQTDVAHCLRWNPGQMSQLLSRRRHTWKGDRGIRSVRDALPELLEGLGGVATVEELAAGLLAARGSELTEPRRSRVAGALVRAALEAEGASADPRFHQRRHRQRLIVATRDELDAWARRLAQRADELAQEEAVPSRQSTLDALRAISPPPSAPHLSDARLVRLAAACSEHAAASGRLEIYPRGLAAERALELSQAALLAGPQGLAADEVRARVAARYPEAEPLPERPELDELVGRLPIQLVWDPELRRDGAYRPKQLSAPQTTYTSLTTAPSTRHAARAEPAEVRTRRFDERLQRVVERGGFLVLTCRPSDLLRVEAALTSRLGLQQVSLEGDLVASMREAAQEAGASWDVVLRADGAPRHTEAWHRLMRLVGRAREKMLERLTAVHRPALLTRPGLLARYEALSLIDEVRERTGHDGPPATILLVASGHHDLLPVIDDTSLPVIADAQWESVPSAWLARNDSEESTG